MNRIHKEEIENAAGFSVFFIISNHPTETWRFPKKYKSRSCPWLAIYFSTKIGKLAYFFAFSIFFAFFLLVDMSMTTNIGSPQVIYLPLLYGEWRVANKSEVGGYFWNLPIQKQRYRWIINIESIFLSVYIESAFFWVRNHPDLQGRNKECHGGLSVFSSFSTIQP